MITRLPTLQIHWILFSTILILIIQARFTFLIFYLFNILFIRFIFSSEMRLHQWERQRTIVKIDVFIFLMASTVKGFKLCFVAHTIRFNQDMHYIQGSYCNFIFYFSQSNNFGLNMNVMKIDKYLLNIVSNYIMSSTFYSKWIKFIPLSWLFLKLIKSWMFLYSNFLYYNFIINFFLLRWLPDSN
jgi:hypothetical protein